MFISGMLFGAAVGLVGSALLTKNDSKGTLILFLIIASIITGAFGI